MTHMASPSPSQPASPAAVAGAVSFVERTPRAPLSRYVSAMRYLLLRGTPGGAITVVSDPSALTEIVVATTPCMIDHHPEGGMLPKPGEFVFGTMTSERAATVLLDRASQVRVLSIVLRPGVLFELARVAAPELRDRVVPADEIVPRSLLAALRAELSTDDGCPRWSSIEGVLLRVFADVNLPDPRLRLAARRILVGPIGEALESARLSSRHAERMFARAFGFTPKQLQRLERFRSVASRLGRHGLPEGDRLAALAAAAGYADQSHLTREFREFSGTTPSRYAAKRATALYLGAAPDGGNVQEPADDAP